MSFPPSCPPLQPKREGNQSRTARCTWRTRWAQATGRILKVLDEAQYGMAGTARAAETGSAIRRGCPPTRESSIRCSKGSAAWQDQAQANAAEAHGHRGHRISRGATKRDKEVNQREWSSEVGNARRKQNRERKERACSGTLRSGSLTTHGWQTGDDRSGSALVRATAQAMLVLT